MKATFPTAQLNPDRELCRDPSSDYPWWLYVNLLSLDAPIVAVVWLGAFSRAFNSSVAFSVYTLLFLAVWMIYIADRLLDGLRQKNWELATERHRFVRRYQKRFMGLLFAIFILATVLALKVIPIDLLVAGLILCSVVALYFIAFVRLFPQLKPLRAKEFACGFVFAVGTALGVDAVRHGFLTRPTIVLPAVFLFAALCIYNCLIIAAQERMKDLANDSFAASAWWQHLDRDLVVFGAILIVMSGAAWLLGGQGYFYLACLISAIALTLVHLFRRRYSDSLSRIMADAVLLSPLLCLV